MVCIRHEGKLFGPVMRIYVSNSIILHPSNAGCTYGERRSRHLSRFNTLRCRVSLADNEALLQPELELLFGVAQKCKSVVSLMGIPVTKNRFNKMSPYNRSSKFRDIFISLEPRVGAGHMNNSEIPVGQNRKLVTR